MLCLVVRVKGIYYGRQHLWVQLSGLIQRFSLVSSMDLLACLTLKKFSLGSTHLVTLTKSFGRIEEFVIHNHITRMLLENSIQPREILGISQRNQLSSSIANWAPLVEYDPVWNFSRLWSLEKFWVERISVERFVWEFLWVREFLCVSVYERVLVSSSIHHFWDWR